MGELIDWIFLSLLETGEYEVVVGKYKQII
jgi:hypothetical protein